MLNRWREVKYDDDGCSIYQCMKCKESWSSRTAPGYTQYYLPERTYTPTFNFCPFCGTKWDKEHTNRTDNNDRGYGPRRLKIYKCFQTSNSIVKRVMMNVWHVKISYSSPFGPRTSFYKLYSDTLEGLSREIKEYREEYKDKDATIEIVIVKEEKNQYLWY